MAEAFAVTGRIADRWLWWGSAGGPFGEPLGPEESVPGRPGMRQRFARGDIAWSPDQDMITSVFLLRNEACFEWSRPHFDVDYYRYDIERDGAGLGQAAFQVRFEGDPEDEQYIWARLQGFGLYTFVVKSCTSTVIGSDDCHGWTVPVRLDFRGLGPSPFPGDLPVEGVIGERWHELGAWSGPLGSPVTNPVFDVNFGGLIQTFQHGIIQTVPANGPRMVVAAAQRELPPDAGSEYAFPCIQLDWGGSDVAYTVFRVDVFHEGHHLDDVDGRVEPRLEWADSGRGSGQFVLPGPREAGGYFFRVYGAIAPAFLAAQFPAEPLFSIALRLDASDQSRIPLEFPALDGSPEAAFASHRDRGLSIARSYARTRPLRVTMRGKAAAAATENDTVRLMAHFAAAAEEPDFAAPGELPSLALAHVALRQLRVGRTGTKTEDHVEVAGVELVEWHRDGDYDAALRGLMVIAFRYAGLLTAAELGFLRHRLIPPGLSDGHDMGIETIKVEVDTSGSGGVLDVVLDVVGIVGEVGLITTPITLQALVDVLVGALPESENHILMTESARYLVNQLFFDATGENRYDNRSNGMTDWLAGWLQRIARHDFMEFSARPYARYSLHPLLNLFEFARDTAITTLAQNILDYTMTKFAVSSSGLRRVNPYRRLGDNRNRVPFKDKDGQGHEFVNMSFDTLHGAQTDQVLGFALAYFGDRDAIGHVKDTYPDEWAFVGVLAGTADYRPPPEAYVLATREVPAMQHRFYHGTRPKVAGSDDVPDGGVEIYYRSRSFLLSAGGMFLNSGYGRDEVFVNFKDAAVAQATTLIPARADVRFQDLIRFDPYPDSRRAVNTGVHLGFACGANLRIPKLWFDLTHQTEGGPWVFLDLNQNLSGFGPLGFYVACYGTRVADGSELPADAPDNLGMLYAVEAVRPDGTTLPFDEFVTATRNANVLPTQLVYNQTYDFHTGDGHTFRCWLSTDGAKYSARVRAMDGQDLPDDLRSATLADGPYISAPGMHDGQLSISSPDCPTPLILDSRDARFPTRTDNDQQCPGYRHRRATALIAMADQSLAVSIVRAATDPQGAVRAARSAAGVLRDFTPPEAEAAAYYAMSGRALFDLMGRLDTAGRPGEISALVYQAIVAYLRAVSATGADTFGIAATLRTLSIFASNRHLDHEAVSAQQAAVEVLGGPAPAGKELAFTALGADVAATLAIRLVVAGDLDRVPAAVASTVTAYRRAAAVPGADIAELAGELRHTAAQLTGFGLAAPAAELTALADALAP